MSGRSFVTSRVSVSVSLAGRGEKPKKTTLVGHTLTKSGSSEDIFENGSNFHWILSDLDSQHALHYTHLGHSDCLRIHIHGHPIQSKSTHPWSSYPILLLFVLVYQTGDEL
ncbi:hypothetical protein Y032_0096g2904 [Ancylostoma ceylanicum]|uniref:Uncharacterized protein n=1 Tax=Ancylostoma ceylanicum TaxID=53326 RepID=A0A016TK39_9BILA|nr:hypothetical protein Y032_0096g2904 [Ancylostoma ceylanicum]